MVIAFDKLRRCQLAELRSSGAGLSLSILENQRAVAALTVSG